MNKIDRMGVVVLMAHLLITLAIIILYAITVMKGHPDEALRNLLFMAGGYWFGAFGADKLKNRKKDDGSNE